MPPLLLVPFLLLAAVVAATLMSQMQGPARHQDTFRPRGRPFGSRANPGKAGLVHLVRRAELAGVRDAYSSAPIDASAEIYRCGQCLAMYHAASAEALMASNGGRCAVCGSDDIARAEVVDD